MLTLLAFIFVLGIAILFHEFGHFITAKISGIKVFRFSIGFGPKVTGIFWKGTEYVLCLFPFGGYVKMAGENSQIEKETNKEILSSETVPDEQRFDRKTLFTRASVIINGPIMNIVLAILLLIIVFLFSGTAQITNTISEVEQGSPAAEAGILGGDQIIAIDSNKIEHAHEISEMINKNKEEVISIKILRNDDVFETNLTPEYKSEHERAMIGITLEVTKVELTFYQSIKKSIVTTGEIIALIGRGFVEMFTGNMPVELAGPLGIAQMAGEAAQVGFLNLLFFTAVINIFLGIINLFPIPILDGGQIVLLAIEKIRGKPLEPEHINFLYMIGMALIVMIFIIATYQDILRIFLK
ncbi:MAG: RIP metalloprotease RseP [Atribacterota bacterium]